MRFWDSSAIVPLVVKQGGSKDAETWLVEDPTLVLWTLTTTEVTSALRRLVRDGLFVESTATRSERLLAGIVSTAHVVADVERVKSKAARLLRVHPLRAADALQLGAACLWADGSPGDLRLHTFDERLRVAAEREGFVVDTRSRPRKERKRE